MTAPAHAHLHRAIAPGWCDRHGKPRFHWLRQLYATFGPKNFSGRLTNDRLSDWKVIAWAAAINGTGVALVSAAQTSMRRRVPRDISVHANHIGECHASRQQTAASEGRLPRRLRRESLRGRQGRAGRKGAGHVSYGGVRRLDRFRQSAAGHPPATQRLRDLGAALWAGRHARRAARLSDPRRRSVSRAI